MICASPSAQAIEEERDITIADFVVRQERVSFGSISVLRPLPLDELIRDVMVVNNIASLQDYLGWLQANITYEKDLTHQDRWSAPEETLKAKRGDCEDYAFLNEAVLRVMGLKPQVLALGGVGGQHAICVFKNNDEFFWIDNAELKTTTARTLEEFARHIFSACGGCYLLSVNLPTHDWDILFKRSVLVGQ
ncbi:MAG: transglutaminase-like domain-containing protein [Candidatus Omnitrophota bacterium]